MVALSVPGCGGNKKGKGSHPAHSILCSLIGSCLVPSCSTVDFILHCIYINIHIHIHIQIQILVFIYLNFILLYILAYVYIYYLTALFTVLLTCHIYSGHDRQEWNQIKCGSSPDFPTASRDANKRTGHSSSSTQGPPLLVLCTHLQLCKATEYGVQGLPYSNSWLDYTIYCIRYLFDIVLITRNGQLDKLQLINQALTVTGAGVLGCALL